MSKRKIITTPDPRLRERARKVSEITDDTHQLIADMVETSLEWERHHPNELSAAMAAPQIGELHRVIILRDDLDDKDNQSFTALINPEIIRTEGATKTDYEGCLSVPDSVYGLIARPDKVKIKALLADGTPVRIKANGHLARTILHEIDHLNGVLFIDYIRDQADAFFRLDERGELQPLDYDTEIRNNTTLWGN
jgi:peptide deformylase